MSGLTCLGCSSSAGEVVVRKATRTEDMGSGSLELMICEDGDIHVTVREAGELGFGSSIEFCLSGCDSPNTLVALRKLLAAMQQDNAERPQAGRR